MVETILLALAFLAWGYSNDNVSFVGFSNHPYYIIVILIGIRYGFLKSMISTAFLVTTYLAFSPALSLPTILEALSLLAFSMFIGLLVEVDKKKIIDALKLISDYKANISLKSYEIKKLLKINKNISDQLTTADQSFNLVFHDTKSFYQEDLAEIYSVAYNLLKKTIKATEAYVFVLEDDDTLKPIFPADKTESAMELVADNFETIKHVQNSLEFYRLNKDESNNKNSPVFIGPIIHEQSNHQYGLLVVKDIDFINFNEGNFITFKNLCKWLGAVLQFRSTPLGSSDESVAHRPTPFDYLVTYGASRETIHDRLMQYLD